jgi:hypothetical protein
MNLLLIALILTLQAPAPAAESLRHRYGGPVAEVFLVRKDITATVTYDHGGQVSTMLLEPVPQWFGGSQFDEDSAVLSTSQVMDIFNDVAPMSSRGRLLEGPRLARHSWQYENVSLFLAGKDDGWKRARIVFEPTAAPSTAQPN